MCLASSFFFNEPVLNLFARPGRFAQKSETGLHGWIESKTADGNAPPHFAPAVALNQLVYDVLQRDAMQGITGIGNGRCHTTPALTKLDESKALSSEN